MKSLKLVSMAIFSMAMVLVSCSGSDGETGQQGVAGTDGINGTDGADGEDGISCWDLNGNGTGDAEEDTNGDTVVDALDCQGENGSNGEDGNANVQEFEFNLFEFADYTLLNLDLDNIVDVPANYAYLFYIDTPGGLRYFIPGNLVNNTHYARVYINKDTGAFQISFYDSDDNPYVVAGGQYESVIVVAIELTNASKSSESVMSELKAAGVDTSDYNAVAEYFGLE